MATSVFLFQVQTSKPFEYDTLEDLKYCTIALREVAAVNKGKSNQSLSRPASFLASAYSQQRYEHTTY